MAADSTAVRAGKAYVEIFADDSPLARGLKRAQKRIEAWGAGLRSIGTKVGAVGLAMVTPFLAAAKVFADAGSALDDMSQRTGASIEALSGLKYAAEQSGTSVESLENGMRKLSVNLSEAVTGSKSAQANFAALGLSWKKLSGMKPDQQFLAVADAVSRVRNPAQRAAAAMSLLGKGGSELLPLMSGGAKGINELTKEAERLGLVMSTDDAQAAAAFGDSIDKATSVVKSGIYKIGAALMPVLNPMLDRFTEFAAVTSKWIDQNRGLVVTAFSVAGSVLAAGAALYSMGVGLKFAAVAMGPIRALLPVIAFGVKALTMGLGAMASAGLVAVKAALAAVMAGLSGFIPLVTALASPIGLAALALAGLAAWMASCVDWATIGGDALSDLSSGFTALQSETLGTLNAIGNAIAKGDLSLATAVAWGYIKMEWIKGTNFLWSIWSDITNQIVDAWMGVVFGMVSFATTAWNGLKLLWQSVTGAFTRASIAVISGFMSGWIKALAFVEGLWIRFKGLFDKSINVRMELEGLDNKTRQKLFDNRQNAGVMDAGSRERQLAEQQAIINQQKEMEKTLAEQRAAGEQARNAEREASLAEAEAELQKARENWAEAADQANETTKKASEVNSPVGAFSGLGDAVANSSIMGTFNPFGVRGLESQNDGPLQILVNGVTTLVKEVQGARSDERVRPKL